MRWPLTIVTFLCLLVQQGLLLGQSNLGSSFSISLEQGLSDRTVKQIIQDPFGYIWIATRNGLNRYDGLNILRFDDHRKSKMHISYKDIHQIVSRPDGTIIIHYEDLKGFLDVLPENQATAVKLYLNEENGIRGALIEDIHMDELHGDVYVLSREQEQLFVQKLKESDNEFELLYSVSGIQAKDHMSFEFIMLDRGDIVLNDGFQSLYLVDTGGSILNQIYYDSLTQTNGVMDVFLQDRQGRCWLSFADAPGLFEYNEAAATFTTFSIDQDDAQVDAVWNDKIGNVIVCVNKDQQDPAFYLIKSDDVVRPFAALSDINYSINDIASNDFERLLLVGTTNGLKRVIQSKKQVKTYLQDKADEMRGITGTPDGTIYVAGAGLEWYRLHPSSDSTTTIPLDFRFDPSLQYTSSACNLVYDTSGYIWGVRHSQKYGGELIKYDLVDSTFESYLLPHRNIITFAIGPDRLIYMLSTADEGPTFLSSFDPKQPSFSHYFTADGLNPVENEVVTCLEMGEERIWIGTSDNGVIEINLKNDARADIDEEEEEYFGLTSRNIQCLHEDQNGNLWIGTDAGVNVYDIETQEFRFYDTRDGLVDNDIRTILEDENGNFWFSTFNGLSYFNDTLRTFRNFSVDDGLTQRSFNRFSAYQDLDGGLYFGGRNGVEFFHPNEMLERNLDAPILISSMSYYDREVGSIIRKVRDVINVEQIRLPASNRYFECSFALADFTYPSLNQFEYRLVGLDEEWNQSTTQNTLRFNNLASGNYTLQIRGRDRNLNLSSQLFELPIKVEEFFYKKSWFLLLCVALFSFIVYVFHRIQLQQAINMERFRTKISSDLHDDVGGLLSGLAMQTELLEFSASEADKPKLKRISDMSRNAMAQMRDVIWATDARKDRFEDLLTRMKEYAAEILFPRAITCYFHSKGINLEKRIPVQVRQNLYLIFKEAITNVAKHSNATQADVTFIKEGSVIKMEIRDNGTSLNGYQKQSSSLHGAGLKNMQMRAENIKASLSINKENGFRVALEMKAFV